jgi:putative transposase
MKRSKFTDEQILAIVKEGEAGSPGCGPLCRSHGITEQTYYRWKATGAKPMKSHETNYLRQSTNQTRLQASDRSNRQP